MAGKEMRADRGRMITTASLWDATAALAISMLFAGDAADANGFWLRRR